MFLKGNTGAWLGLPWAQLTYAVIIYFRSSHFLVPGVILSGRDGYHIFKDLEAETIHVCIAWALLQYSGFVFVFLSCVHHPSLLFIVYLLLVMVLLFPVHRFEDG